MMAKGGIYVLSSGCVVTVSVWCKSLSTQKICLQQNMESRNKYLS